MAVGGRIGRRGGEESSVGRAVGIRTLAWKQRLARRAPDISFFFLIIKENNKINKKAGCVWRWHVVAWCGAVSVPESGR